MLSQGFTTDLTCHNHGLCVSLKAFFYHDNYIPDVIRNLRHHFISLNKLKYIFLSFFRVIISISHFFRFNALPASNFTRNLEKKKNNTIIIKVVKIQKCSAFAINFTYKMWCRYRWRCARTINKYDNDYEYFLGLQFYRI